MQKILFTLLAIFGLVSFSAQADTGFAKQIADNYAQLAKAQNPKSVVTADAGHAFYTKKVVIEGKDLSCSACHTDNPTNTGKHNESGKAIQPLAPSVNPQRFSDRNKSEAAFTKHCKDLYGKDCSAQNKAEFVTYLLSIK